MERPLFLIGTGRCGSTALHRILVRHREAAWLSQYSQRFPGHPAINAAAMTLIDVPFAATMIRRFVRPAEAYRFWDRHYLGFGSPCRDLVAEDVPATARFGLQRALGPMLTRRRRRLLVKITGWPRLGFLKEVFPDAKFVHIYRDGRAVASSLMQKPWWGGWGGPGNWKWGELTAQQQAKWEQHGKSFVVLAGIQWEILMEAFQRARARVPATDILEISYEELCRDKLGSLRRLTEFANLGWTAEYERVIQTFPLVNTNHKWRAHFSDVQQRQLEEALSDSLLRYGYSAVGPARREPPIVASARELRATTR